MTSTASVLVGGMSALPDIADLNAAFEALEDHWSPRVVAEMNGQYVKVAKLLGEFVWHDHAGEDELFWVVSGTLRIRYRDREDVVLRAGQMHVVPRGVEHFPVAEEECRIVLIEPKSTAHTGEVETERSKTVAEQLA